MATIEKQGDRLYVKAFLLDASTNLNDWGVTEASLDENINTFIGKPLVLTENYDHPDIDDGNLSHVFANQEPFRIGTIIEIIKAGSRYDALIEITDSAAKQILESAQAPPFVSPAIYPLGKEAQADAALYNWTGVHLAIVDDPAYTVKKAQIKSTCAGEKGQCLLQLRKARAGNTCGFCIKTALSRLLIKNDDSSLTSLKHEPQNSGRMVETPQAPALDASKFVSLEDHQKLVAENTKLKADYGILQTAHESLKKEAGETAQRVAALEQASRRSKIAGIITPEVIKDEKKREETINSLTALNLKDEDFNKAIAPLMEVAKIKQAKFQYTGDEEEESAADETPYYARMFA